MTPERFQTIVEAYGADPRRWPEQERAAAEAWAALHRDEAQTMLSGSAGLDAWLGSHSVAPPDRELEQRIVASGPKPRAPRLRRMVWWSGAAVAGVGLAGGLAGAFVVSFFVLTGAASPVHELSYLTTAFGGSSADWSGE
jgi:hypothetical protein